MGRKGGNLLPAHDPTPVPCGPAKARRPSARSHQEGGDAQVVALLLGDAVDHPAQPLASGVADRPSHQLLQADRGGRTPRRRVGLDLLT